MSGPQFVHMDTYARSVSKLRREREITRVADGKVGNRKLTVEEVCGEAARSPGFHPHITEAKPPTLFHGVSPSEIPAMIEARVAAANAKIRASKAQLARGERADGERAIRKDTHVLMTMVASYPVPWTAIEPGGPSLEDPIERALYEQWCELDVEFARAKSKALGFELLSSVGHTDEPYPHNHHIGVALSSRLEARSCHPGYIAKHAVVPENGEDAEQTRTRANKAYRDAMRAFQDDYQKRVGRNAGLTRMGPNRGRLPRAVWVDRKAIAKEIGQSNLRNAELRTENAATKAEHEGLQKASTSILDEIVSRTDALVAVAGRAAEIDAQAETAAADAAEKQMQSQSLANEMARQEAIGAQRRQQIAADLALDEAAAAVAKKKRIEAEAATAAAIEQNHQLRQAGAEREDRLRRTERELTSRATELDARERELEKLQRTARNLQADVEAITDGIVAYAEGRILYDPSMPETPFTASPRKDGSHHHLRARLAPVRDKLLPIISVIDKAVTKRSVDLKRAVTATMSEWSTGLLVGLGVPRPDGRPTFKIQDTPDRGELLAKIAPFRDEIGGVLAALPDRSLIAGILTSVGRMRQFLSRAEQQCEIDLRNQMAALQRHSSEREL